MKLLRPTRRELIAAAPLLLGAAALPPPSSSAADGDALNFLVLGDWGRDGKDFQRHVALQMGLTARDRNSAFTVSTGDNFYLKGVSSKTDRQWRTSFEEIYTDESLQRPWYPVLGNHDYGGDAGAQIRRSEIDRRWRMENYWYEVNEPPKGGRPEVQLLFLNTVVWIGKEAFPFKWLGSDIHPGQQKAQKEWLIGKLGRAGPRVKLVFGHHPIYSVGPHGGKPKLQDLDAILRDYGVNAYVCGHDHCLYHISRDGMDYVCSGAGSQILTGYTGGVAPGCVLKSECGPNPTDPTPPVWHAYLSIAGFAAFQVRGEGVDFQFVDMAGHVRHSVTL
jgi:tartrate-resistant acid phosphatase type 5